jgi:very-short-patch-repair endonuclease
LRTNATEAEKILWRALRELTLPVNVRRQHPIGRYIADFAIPAHKLVIEIDGGHHATSVGADEERTRVLNTRGCRVNRFWNNDVLGNIGGVLESIVAEIGNSPTSP